jgi:hypothetical protein
VTAANDPDHQSLPEWLQRRAEQCASAPALLCKRRGVWLEQSWAELAASVASTAATWRDHGFSLGDQLRVDAPPVPDVFRHCLAAWWLGGGVVVIDGDPRGQPSVEAARFALAGNEAARARLVAARPAGAAYTLGVQLEGDTALAPAGWRSGSALAASVAPAPARAHSVAPEAVALVRQDAAAGVAAEHRLSHAELVASARAPFELDVTGSRALAGRGLSLGAQLETVLGAWLVGGFTLGFVEAEATEHGDRRELEPHLLFDSAGGYAALADRIDANLPPPESRERRWLERALDGAPRIGRRLVTSRLRTVVGLRRTRRALVVGGAPERPPLERLLDIPVGAWPAQPPRWAGGGAEAGRALLGSLELARTGSEVA